MITCYEENAGKSTELFILDETDYESWLTKQTEFVRQYLKSTEFSPKKNHYALIFNATGHLDKVLVICKKNHTHLELLADLPYHLPEGVYHLGSEVDFLAKLGWALGAYRFTRYKRVERASAKLVLKSSDKEVRIFAEAIYKVRDLINTPSEDMHPAQLAQELAHIAKNHGAVFNEIVGDDLVTQNFPAIHAVGRAADFTPRLAELFWGNPKHPKIVLVGKGVCFDSGGLNIKSATGMRQMKKDMGGAANVIGLAQMIMECQLPIYLHVLIPCVENAISGNAFRPGDVLTMRNGKTVEVDNTDAEGRLILADAMAYAVEKEAPTLLIDFATLTGAARVAVGTEIGAYFTNKNDLVCALNKAAETTEDPLWQLPLHTSYFKQLKSHVADFKNSGDSYAGAITAALFLKEFVSCTIPWIHIDIMAANVSSRIGHPEGGEAMGIRAVFEYLRNHVCQK
jgi:leucyl aminopeptidase